MLIPFLFMFAAMIIAPARAIQTDARAGRKAGGDALAVVGFIVTAMSIVLACIPPDEPNKMLEIMRVVGLSLVLVGIRLLLSAQASPGDRVMLYDETRTPHVRRHSVRRRHPARNHARRLLPRETPGKAFGLDRIVIEPLPAGIPRGARRTNGSKYLFEVVDAPARRALLKWVQLDLREWERPLKRKRTDILESLRFPAPDRPVRIVVRKRDARNVFRDAWTLKLDPADKFIVRGADAGAGPLLKRTSGAPPGWISDRGDGFTRGRASSSATRAGWSQCSRPRRSRTAHRVNIGVSPAAARSGRLACRSASPAVAGWRHLRRV